MDFWPLELQKNKSSIVLSHQIGGNLLQQPQETNTHKENCLNTVIPSQDATEESVLNI